MIITRSFSASCARFVWIATGVALSACAIAEPREVSITITVQTDTGQPIADCPIDVSSFQEGIMVFTDAAGVGHATITVDDEEDHALSARLWNGDKHTQMTLEQTRLARDRFGELSTTLAFPFRGLIPLSPTESNYSKTIIAKSPVEIRARVRTPENTQWIGGATIQSYWAKGASDPALGEQLVIPNAPSATAITLWLGGQSQQATRLKLTAAQTAADVDLGDIFVSYAETDSPINVSTLNAFNYFDDYGENCGRYGTLISTDGQRIYTFSIDPQGKLAAAGDTPYGTPAHIAGGDYFVIPSHAMADPAFQLLRCIDAGKIAELEAAGVPKIAATPTETVTLQFDSPAAYEAVKAVAATLPPE